MNANEIKVVEAFIAAINRHDLSGLSSLMTEDHTFWQVYADWMEGCKTIEEDKKCAV